jgi:AcrR family transcriptional regulator
MSTDEAAGRRERIVASAVDVFGRYGFRRTSMELLAEAAGVSRPGLYQYFRNKRDVFAAVAELVGARMAEDARAAAAAGASAGERLYAVLAVKLETAIGVSGAGYLAELVAEADAMALDAHGPVKEPLVRVVEEVVAGEAGIDPGAAGMRAREAAELLLDAAAGIGRADGSADVRRRRLRQLVELTVRGLGRTAADPTPER